MSTSAAAIKAAIETQLTAQGFNLVEPQSWMTRFITALSIGLYAELQKLEDTAGNPPSPGHQ